MHSKEAIDVLIKHYNFHTVLDVGSGGGEHADLFISNGKSVTCVDLGTSIYFKKKPYNVIIQDFNDFEVNQKYDLVWCSHVLEHQKDVGSFIKKVYDLINDNGFLCITVPPMKHNIVVGHLILRHMGL